MASLLLIKKVNSVSSLFLSTRHQNLSILTPLLHFSTSTQTQPKDDLPFIAQYLMSSFGFSKDRALMVSTQSNLAAIKTPDRPESVVNFLKNAGLTDIQIKHAVSRAPRLLSHSLSKTLEPCAREVIAAGFTQKTLLQLIQFKAVLLTHKKLLSRLQFWRNFFGNNEETLLKLLKNRMFLNLDIDEKLGLLFERIEKLGFPRGSKMFLFALEGLGGLRKDTFDRKVMFFKTAYGWSDEDINSALKRLPKLLTLSQEKVESNMDFLTREVGLNPRSIALRPILLALSLERRLIPRHHVLTVLKSKGLKNKCNLHSVAGVSEKQFVERYILPYSKDLPNLQEKYAAACAGKMSLS